jgi:hypothetical protein
MISPDSRRQRSLSEMAVFVLTLFTLLAVMLVIAFAVTHPHGLFP